MTINLGKSSTKMWATSARSKQSPIGRKFAQSGHPVDELTTKLQSQQVNPVGLSNDAVSVNFKTPF
jgi:hypothetical protein